MIHLLYWFSRSELFDRSGQTVGPIKKIYFTDPTLNSILGRVGKILSRITQKWRIADKFWATENSLKTYQSRSENRFTVSVFGPFAAPKGGAAKGNK